MHANVHYQGKDDTQLI